MEAALVITKMEQSGITLTVKEGKLVLDADTPLTDKQRDYIRQHKAELIEAAQASHASTARQRLELFANEFSHPLADLLDWYQSPDDMETLGSISMDETRKAVSFYVKNLDINRYEGYVPIGYRPGKPTEKTWVMCINCQHFTPDDITGGGGAGIGECAEGVVASPPCYPKAQRHCAGYQALT